MLYHCVAPTTDTTDGGALRVAQIVAKLVALRVAHIHAKSVAQLVAPRFTAVQVNESI